MLVDLFKKYNKLKFVSDMYWTVFATIIVGVSALALQTLVGYSFTSSGLGVYSQVIAIYVILTSISGFGLEFSTLKHSAEYSSSVDELGTLYSMSQFMITLIGVLLVSIVYLLIYIFPSLFSSIEVATGLKYILPGVLFFSLNKNSNALVSGLRNLKLYSAVRGLRWILIMIMSLSVLFFKLELNFILVSYSFVELLIFIFFIIINFKYIKLKINLKWIKIHLKYGVNNVLSSIIAQISSNLIILISGYYLSKSETGVIAFMLTFASIFYIFSSSIQINFNPIFVKKWANNEISSIYIDLKKIFKFTLISVFPLFLVCIGAYYLYSNYFMVGEFKNSTSEFLILAIGTMFTYLLAWPSTILVMAGMLKENLIRVGLISLANIIISFFMIVSFGFYGGLIAFTSVSVISVFINNYIINYATKINLIEVLKNCLRD